MRGEAETYIAGLIDLILLKVISLGECYGYGISKTISSMTENTWEMKEATMYSGLRRLVAEKLITARWGDDESNGGRRKYYSLTPHGEERFNIEMVKWVETKKIIDKILIWEGADEQRTN